MERNPIISGSAVAFRKDFYAEKKGYFSPYVYDNPAGGLERRQLGNESYNYQEKEWFAEPMRTGKAHWSEPYFDTGGGEMIMTTYSLPLYDGQNNVYAVFTADISLTWLTELVNSIRPYPRSYNLMVGREGTYIVHHRPERIESELRIASDIQMGMIPKLFPPFPERKDIDLFAVLKPAKEVGGDLYDFFIHEGKLIFVIGDVSGKGVPASLLMAVTRSLFRTIAVHRDRACEIVGALNRAVSDNNESNMFITLFLGILDLGTGRLVYCNAGHNPPVLSGRGEEPNFLACTSNIPIGVFGDFEYEEEYLDLGFERMLLLYTDGLTEAENRDSSLYSEARLLSTMQTMGGLSARETVETLEESVRTFAGGAEQSDDLTMLALQLKRVNTNV